MAKTKNQPNGNENEQENASAAFAAEAIAQQGLGADKDAPIDLEKEQMRKTIADLTARLSEKPSNEVSVENEVLKKTVSDLTAKLNNTELSKKVKAPVLDFEGKKIKVNVLNFTIETGETKTIEDLKNDKELVRALLDMKSQVLEILN